MSFLIGWNIAGGGCSSQYYIVSQANEAVGLFGYVNCFLPHFAYAEAKGMIPIVDMKSYGNIYKPRFDSSINSWELYFEQPAGFSLKELPNDAKAVQCPSGLWYRWMPSSNPMMSDEDIAFWHTMYKRYVVPNVETRDYFEKEERACLIEPENTVGVIYRGTTYTRGHASGHPVQPTMEELANAVRRTMNKDNLKLIYIASDERSVVDFFEERFPGKVLINQRVYYDEVPDVDYGKYNIDGTDITGELFDRPNNNYLIGLEYLSSINLVSKCASLVAGACGGTTAALYMNGLRYRSRYIFDLGRYS